MKAHHGLLLIINVKGIRQVIVSATNRIRAYDFITGRLIWECSGMTDNVIPHPVEANGIVYIMSGYRGSALLAIDLSMAKGDITGTDAIIWKYDKDTSYTPSPVLIDGKIYFFRVNNGDLSCLDAKDGRVYYSKKKLEGLGNVFTSPVSTKEYLFVMGGTGTGYVIMLGSEFKIVSKNELEDSFHASPAIVGDSMYLRGFKYLYCIAAGS
jgi:outer membrane protein assembly factor BamB